MVHSLSSCHCNNTCLCCCFIVLTITECVYKMVTNIMSVFVVLSVRCLVSMKVIIVTPTTSYMAAMYVTMYHVDARQSDGSWLFPYLVTTLSFLVYLSIHCRLHVWPCKRVMIWLARYKQQYVVHRMKNEMNVVKGHINKIYNGFKLTDVNAMCYEIIDFAQGWD